MNKRNIVIAIVFFNILSASLVLMILLIRDEAKNAKSFECYEQVFFLGSAILDRMKNEDVNLLDDLKNFNSEYRESYEGNTFFFSANKYFPKQIKKYHFMSPRNLYLLQKSTE